MVERVFFAQDNESLVVTSSSNGSIVGNGIINNSDTPNGTVFEYSSGMGTTITLDDTFDVDVFNDDDTANHTIIDGGGIVANGQGVESESVITVRALDAGGNPTGPEIDIYVFSQGGVTQDVWGYASSAPLQDGVSYVKVSGSNLGASDYADYITCFGEGTLIRTEVGDLPVEDLRVGTKVWTRDAGFQEVLWIGHTEVAAKGAYAPVVIEAGAIGNSGTLVVSQQHRVLIDVPATEMLFGQAEVLVAAKHLCGMPGVSIRESGTVRYTHFMFDRHHIVQSNGALTESFFLTKNSVSTLSSSQRSEILSLFPALQNADAGFDCTAAMTIGSGAASVLRAYM